MKDFDVRVPHQRSFPHFFTVFLQMQNVEALKNLQLRQLRGVETTGADTGSTFDRWIHGISLTSNNRSARRREEEKVKKQVDLSKARADFAEKIWDFWKRVFFQDFLVGWIPFMTELNLQSTIISWICGCLSWNEGGIPSQIGNCKNSTWALFMMSATGRWSREWESSKGMYSVRGTKLANKRL